MSKLASVDTQYSDKYRLLFANALLASKSLGLERPVLISEKLPVEDDMLQRTSSLLSGFSSFLSVVQPGYWGNACQTLAANIFGYLNAQGIVADIVIGNVFVRHIDEFQASIESLQQELSKTRATGCQKLHAWVSLGDDVIIDAAMPPRLVKNYNAPVEWSNTIFIARASQLALHLQLKYQPLIVGSEFLAKTSSKDPLEFQRRWESSTDD
jgi:hypothetical protein